MVEELSNFHWLISLKIPYFVPGLFYNIIYASSYTDSVKIRAQLLVKQNSRHKNRVFKGVQ